MAKKRMISNDIIDSDAFLDMPVSSQALYFHLNMRADDEGFINKPRSIMRLCSCSANDLDVLVAKSFIIQFETGVVVVKHWLINNSIRKDRVSETRYELEKSMLYVKENDAYTLDSTQGIPLCTANVKKLPATCQPVVNQMSTTCQPNVSVDKIRLDKNSLDKNREEKKREEKKPRAKKPNGFRDDCIIVGEYENVYLKETEIATLSKDYGEKVILDKIEDLSRHIENSPKVTNYKNHKATLQTWLRRDGVQKISEQKQKASEPDWDESDMQPEIILPVPDDLDMDNLPF